MACPTCDHKLVKVGVMCEPYTEVGVFWCRRCGTIAANTITECDDVPKIVERLRHLERFIIGRDTEIDTIFQPGDGGEAFDSPKRDWVACRDMLPPVNVIVMTKIDDATGCRCEQALKRVQRAPETRSLWFFPDDSMYVYYEPTHWAAVSTRKGKK